MMILQQTLAMADAYKCDFLFHQFGVKFRFAVHIDETRRFIENCNVRFLEENPRNT
jgi:hypothetical protein